MEKLLILLKMFILVNRLLLRCKEQTDTLLARQGRYYKPSGTIWVLASPLLTLHLLLAPILGSRNRSLD